MSITLDDIPLHEDLYWADEFGWSPVASSLDYALSLFSPRFGRRAFLP